ncbi:MAG: prolipoprotein diacylglyceryl transferase [Pseudomonadota bacterium]|nr:prolipoprotein diacylglyceryl transferase [Pseudomonadota bacterium]
MIPYIDLPVFHLGPIPIDPWGTLVCLGFILGLEMARARGIKTGLDVRDVIDGIVATVLTGFVVGHLVHVLAYNPQQLQDEGEVFGVHIPAGPYALLRIWAGFSSFGGFIGAVIGSTLFYKVIRKRDFWPHADAIMFGFPFGWFFGRLGCFSVHDHIGRPTDFFLGVQFPGGTRFDLGFLEALVAAAIGATFLLLARKPRVPGTFIAAWGLIYAPARFGLDFLRNTDLRGADVRWAGFTPAQWGCVVMFGASLALLAYLHRKGSEQALSPARGPAA